MLLRIPSPLRAALLFLVGVVGLGAPARAGATPRGASWEDAAADGDVDREDLAVARRPWAGLARGLVGRSVPRTAPGGSAWISLVAFARPASGSREEVGGGVVVGVPLDRLARTSARREGLVAAAPPPRSEPSDASPETETPTPPLERVRDVERAGLPVLGPRVARACVAAAWRASGLGADDARIDAVVARARWSALLPEARIRAIRGQDERASLETTAADDASRVKGSAGADLTLEARLTWRLDRLLFADDEPSFERLRLERHDARMRIAARTLEALFHWQRAAVDLRTAPTPRDEGEQVLRMTEAEATLDVLTNGWFSQAVQDGVVVEVPSEEGAQRDAPKPKRTDAPSPRAAAAGQGGT